MLQEFMQQGCTPNPNQRAGQWLMNSLYEFDPALYKTITGTDVDCFYDDDKWNAAYEVICWYWTQMGMA